MNKKELDFNLNVQAHLFIGSNQKLIIYINDLLKNLFCNNQCNSCNNCLQLTNNVHPQILWLKSERQYSLEQIDLVLKKISFKLENNEYFFTIFEHAELLTVACSNRLLKSIEEPPTGYYFIFLTNQPKLILPTIYSRCVVTDLYKILEDKNEIKNSIKESEIGKFFIDSNIDPVDFLKVIDKSNINENDTIKLVNLLLMYWSFEYKKALVENDKLKSNRLFNLIEVLNKSLEMPPMPGSSKIFWKNLLINFTLN